MAKTPTSTRSKSRSSSRKREPLLAEVAWEVVNQVGGIYTVIRSKVPAMAEKWGSRYCVVGPYDAKSAEVEFEEHAPTGPFGQAVKTLREWGFGARYGYWLVTGRPRAVLLDLASAGDRIADIKYQLWRNHGIQMPGGDELVDQVTLFGFLVEQFFQALCEREGGRRAIVGHFHEWMAGSAVPEIRRTNLPVGVVFTTHATLLGRYLAMNTPSFYDQLPFFQWEAEARKYQIEPQVRIERAAAHGAHVFTTVSEVTAWECEHLLGRKVDRVLPNALNIERFTALHEFQNLHREYKSRIHRFVMGHFFATYPFDLDKTLYFFTSGRYEFRNKGFDVTIESLARLNHRLQAEGVDRTVVCFFITKRPFRSINAEVLQSRAVMEELRDTCEHIQEQIGDRLFVQTAMGKWPRLDDLADEYWRLRLRRTQAAWRRSSLPIVVTHDLVDDSKDEILNQVRGCNLVNNAHDKVKVVYHPDFISPGNPLFGMEYDQFVRGCHLGVFPSYYEPWGYTPLECIARGIPAITSDLSGFGAYAQQHFENPEELGIHIAPRRNRHFNDTVEFVTNAMYNFVTMDRRARIAERNTVEGSSVYFDWHRLAEHYHDAHDTAAALVSP